MFQEILRTRYVFISFSSHLFRFAEESTNPKHENVSIWLMSAYHPQQLPSQLISFHFFTQLVPFSVSKRGVLPAVCRAKGYPKPSSYSTVIRLHRKNSPNATQNRTCIKAIFSNERSEMLCKGRCFSSHCLTYSSHLYTPLPTKLWRRKEEQIPICLAFCSFLLFVG